MYWRQYKVWWIIRWMDRIQSNIWSSGVSAMPNNNPTHKIHRLLSLWPRAPSLWMLDRLRRHLLLENSRPKLNKWLNAISNDIDPTLFSFFSLLSCNMGKKRFPFVQLFSRSLRWIFFFFDVSILLFVVF